MAIRRSLRWPGSRIIRVGETRSPSFSGSGSRRSALACQRGVEDLTGFHGHKSPFARLVPDLDVIAHMLAGLKIDDEFAQHELGPRWRCD